MTERQIYIKIAIAEIQNPTLEVTSQYLEVCELEIIEEKPVIERIKTDKENDMVYIYFKVKNERYFLKVGIDIRDKPRLYFVWTENAHRVYFTAISETKTFEELASYTTLKPLEGYSIGDREQFRNSKLDFTRITYEPIKCEAYDLEEKLLLLLDDLETDHSGILKLTENSNAHIIVCRHQYIGGNTGIGYSPEIISRMSKLNLGIYIDMYIVGEQLRPW